MSSRLIARLDLPLGIGETDAWEEYIQTSHNPRFNSVSTQTTTHDLYLSTTLNVVINLWRILNLFHLLLSYLIYGLAMIRRII